MSVNGFMGIQGIRIGRATALAGARGGACIVAADLDAEAGAETVAIRRLAVFGGGFLCHRTYHDDRRGVVRAMT